MARYIDVDALIKMFNNKAKTDEEMGLYNHLALTRYFITFVERQPTVDVIPKREGIWYRSGQDGSECSLCGKENTNSGNSAANNFCPNCGAHMTYEEEE